MKLNYPFGSKTLAAIYTDLANSGFFDTHPIDKAGTDSARITFCVHDPETGLEGKATVSICNGFTVEFSFDSSDHSFHFETGYAIFAQNDEPFSGYSDRFIAEANKKLLENCP